MEPMNEQSTTAPPGCAPTTGSEADEITLDHSCWCGETKPYYAPLPKRCGGDGYFDCLCGGDFCACHWHGETECYGCADCRDTEDDYD